MSTNDERVERIQRAVEEAHLLTFEGDTIGIRRELSEVRAVLAALDEEPTLEDVLMACGVSMLTVHVLPPKEGSEVRVVLEAQYGDKRRKPKHGTGPTIDAAIRAAVATAKGGEA